MDFLSIHAESPSQFPLDRHLLPGASMTRRAILRSSALILPSLISISGCQPDASPTAGAPAPNGVNYGENKLPPPNQVISKDGKRGRAPGAPPARN